MYIPFNELPDHARVWIYQANRPLTTGEQGVLNDYLQKLCHQWVAHGWPVHSSFQIVQDHFVILAVDEEKTNVSGCSIDSSVHGLKQMQATLGIDFFDRQQVAFEINNRIILHRLSALPALFRDNILTADTLTFNHLVNSKAALAREWKTSVSTSWLSRYLPKSTVAG